MTRLTPRVCGAARSATDINDAQDFRSLNNLKSDPARSVRNTRKVRPFSFRCVTQTVQKEGLSFVVSISRVNTLSIVHVDSNVDN